MSEKEGMFEHMTAKELREYEKELDEIAELTLSYIDAYMSKFDTLLGEGGDVKDLLEQIMSITDDDDDDLYYDPPGVGKAYEEWLQYFG